jgi:hypothetical protein
VPPIKDLVFAFVQRIGEEIQSQVSLLPLITMARVAARLEDRFDLSREVNDLGRGC